MTRSDHREKIAAARAGRGGVRVPYPIGIRDLQVLAVRTMTPRMVRVTLGGPELAGFESHVPIEHVRLIFPDADTGRLRRPEPDGEMLRWPRPFPPSREYTVRRHDRTAGELDLDVVLHDGGLASGWAARVEVGETIPVAGPPGGYVVADTYDAYLLAGDETALPAIGRWLERMPADATGWAVLEVADSAEIQPLRHPGRVKVQWVLRDEGDRLADAVQNVELPRDSFYAWVAGEVGAIRPIRAWLRESGVHRADQHVTGYWKRGESDFDDDEDG